MTNLHFSVEDESEQSSKPESEQDTGQVPNGVDPRNRLNDLTNKEWMISTKSVWRSESAEFVETPLSEEDWQAFTEWLVETKGLEQAERIMDQLLPSIVYSRPPARDELKSQHPATFAESDIEKLILFFTKRGERVLDPFLGTGSALIACRSVGRCGVGIELVDRWAKTARQRLGLEELPLFQGMTVQEAYPQQVLQGDAREVMRQLDDESFDFVVTSPPYWKILHKDTDHKATRERVDKGLETRYSELEADLGNVRSYEEFLDELKKVFRQCWRVLRDRRYMCVVVSDFRDKGNFITFHSDIATAVEACGFALQGITVLVQDSKNLYPYGIPYAFVSNINHQYILVFRKDNSMERKASL